MSRLGFVYDQTKCIGCNACQMACKDLFGLEPDRFFRRVVTMEVTEAGQKRWMHYSGACNHCADAACVKNCPADALYYREDGTVGQHRERCIGCGTCTWACPYGAPFLSARYGISMKCTSCADLRAKGHEPACVEACLTHCLQFRDLDSMTEEEKEGLVSDLPILPPSGLTGPSLLIRRSRQEVPRG